MSRRFDDWPERLDRALQRAASQKFVWGEHDCCLFVCDVILAMTGIDPGAGLRGKYSTELGAGRALIVVGCRLSVDGNRLPETDNRLRDAVQILAKHHGFKGIPIAFAQRGDLLLFDFPDIGPTLGVVGMDGTHAALVTKDGLNTERSVTSAAMAWRVE